MCSWTFGVLRVDWKSVRTKISRVFIIGPKLEVLGIFIVTRSLDFLCFYILE